MSSSSGSTINQSSHASWAHYSDGCARKGNWSGANIAVMVLGFVFLWPVGLAILFWICSGRNVQELPGAIRRLWMKVTGRGGSRGYFNASSENVVFDDYQQTQFDRIREIKEEINARAQRFAEFRSDAQRRKDEEEFNRFMASAPSNNDS